MTEYSTTQGQILEILLRLDALEKSQPSLKHQLDEIIASNIDEKERITRIAASCRTDYKTLERRIDAFQINLNACILKIASLTQKIADLEYTKHQDPLSTDLIFDNFTNKLNNQTALQLADDLTTFLQDHQWTIQCDKYGAVDNSGRKRQRAYFVALVGDWLNRHFFK